MPKVVISRLVPVTRDTFGASLSPNLTQIRAQAKLSHHELKELTSQQAHVDLETQFEPRPKPMVLSTRSTILYIAILCNTIIGTGILSLPFMYATTGIILSTLLILLSALATTYTVERLLECTERFYYNRLYMTDTIPSFNYIAQIAFPDLPFLSTLCDLSSCAYGIGNGAGALVAIGDCFPKGIAAIFGVEANSSIFLHRGLWMLLVVLFMSRSVLQKSMKSMQKTSAVSLMLVVYISANVFSLWFSDERDLHQQSIDGLQGVQMWILSPKIFAVLPIYTIVFSFHQNFFQLYHELRPAGLHATKQIITTSITVCTVIYIVTGITGYLTFQNKTLGNILNNYKPTISITILRIFVSIMATVSFPLQIHPCVPSTYAIFARIAQSCTRIADVFDHHRTAAMSSTTSIVHVDDELLSPQVSSSANSARRMTHAKRRAYDEVYVRADGISDGEHWYAGLFGMGAALTLSIAVTKLDEIFAIVGSVAGTSICLILPSLFTIKLLAKNGNGVFVPYLLTGAGVLIAVVSLIYPYL